MRRAFTLIELLVVVAIIAILISILLPALNDAKRQARTDVCMSNQRQLAIGFLTYASEWSDCLPGGTWDYIGPDTGVTYTNSTPLCWLGSLDGMGDIRFMPYKGTIYRYLGDQVKAYWCPDDKMFRQAQQGNQFRNKPDYSYTAPALLTGAPLHLLNRTHWPGQFTTWYTPTDWDKTTEHSMPWMLVEEDESEYLAFVTDSGWSNVDILTNRHKGRACIAHTDGSVSVRATQRFPLKLDAWKVYYHLSSQAIVNAGDWGRNQGGHADVKFGYIRKARRLNPQ